MMTGRSNMVCHPSLTNLATNPYQLSDPRIFVYDREKQRNFIYYSVADPKWVEG